MTRVLAGKMFIPVTSIALGPRFAESLTVLLSKVVSFTLEEPTDLMLEKLKAYLFRAGKD